ncbi:MAG: LLM class flavin-dependent oxidoreductase [Gammaproteobacteria bacterium]
MRMGIMTGARPVGDDVTGIGRSTTIDEIVALTQRAEAAGYDNVWMANVFALDAIFNAAIAEVDGGAFDRTFDFLANL